MISSAMLEKPNLPDQTIIARLQTAYGLRAARLAFLPLGADVNTAVYRVSAADGSAYFLKLRKGYFDETSVAVPLLLKRGGVQPVIDIIETRAGQPWASLNDFTMILYPFIEGQNGYQVALTDQQWRNFGAAFSAIHSAQVPPPLASLLQRETYSADWRDKVRSFQAQAQHHTFADPSAATLAEFMQAKRSEIDFVIERAHSLAAALQASSAQFVLCHSDIHPGNLLITTQDAFYIVDWDNPILAPKERDLMYINGGVGQAWNSERFEALFYQGYGETQIDTTALAYYRYERIIQDIADFCQQLFASDEGGADRQRGLAFCMGNFLPGHEIDYAQRTEQHEKAQ